MPTDQKTRRALNKALKQRQRESKRKHARDYAPFKSVSGYLILRADGTEVATVHAYHGDGNCVVTVYNHGEGNPDRYQGEDGPSGAVTSSAGGYGYDRFTAALSRCRIDGHTMVDHCGESTPLPKGKTYYPKSYKPPVGFRVANWVSKGEGDDKRYIGHSSCYKESGLDYLKALGYRVFRVV